MRCSFCGLGDHEVRKLVAGPPPHAVCDGCAALLGEITRASEPGAPSPGSCSFCDRSGVTLILPSAVPDGCVPSSICHDCASLVAEVAG